MKLRRTSINTIRAKSLIESSKQAIESASSLVLNTTNKKSMLRELYEGLRQFCEAVGYLKGYKFSSHEEVTFFLKEVLKEDSISLKFDRYRILRNRINYYGDDISEETVSEAIKEIPKMIHSLKKYLGEIYST